MIAEVKVDEKEVQEGLKKLFSSFSCFCAEVIFSVMANRKMIFFQLDYFCQIDTVSFQVETSVTIQKN